MDFKIQTLKPKAPLATAIYGIKTNWTKVTNYVV